MIIRMSNFIWEGLTSGRTIEVSSYTPFHRRFLLRAHLPTIGSRSSNSFVRQGRRLEEKETTEAAAPPRSSDHRPPSCLAPLVVGRCNTLSLSFRLIRMFCLGHRSRIIIHFIFLSIKRSLAIRSKTVDPSKGTALILEVQVSSKHATLNSSSKQPTKKKKGSTKL